MADDVRSDEVCPELYAALAAVLALHKPNAASVRAAILAALEPA